MGGSCTCDLFQCEGVAIDVDTAQGHICDKSNDKLISHNEELLVYRNAAMSAHKLDLLLHGCLRNESNDTVTDIIKLCISYCYQKTHILRWTTSKRQPDEVGTKQTFDVLDMEAFKISPKIIEEEAIDIDPVHAFLAPVISKHGSLLPTWIRTQMYQDTEISFNPHQKYDILTGIGCNGQDKYLAQMLVFEQGRLLGKYSTDIAESAAMHLPRNLVLNEQSNELLGIEGKSLFTLQLDAMRMMRTKANLRVHRIHSSLCHLAANTHFGSSKLMIIGGKTCQENVDDVEQLMINRKNTSCSGFHAAIKECEIFDTVQKKSVAIASMNYVRQNTACIYHNVSNKVVVAGGLLFTKSTSAERHYNHTVETYDFEKDEWTVLPQRLLLHYPLPMLWMDSFDPNIIYIAPRNQFGSQAVRIQWLDIRDAAKNIPHCYTLPSMDSLQHDCKGSADSHQYTCCYSVW